MTNDSQAAREKLWGMIKKHRFAMMTTSHGEGVLRSRPMTTIDRNADEHLWFFAKADSKAAEDLRQYPQVCLSYADGDAKDFVCVAGAAAVDGDVSKKKELWNKMVQAWFPEGPESPDVVLLKVSPDHAEYWDSTSSKLVQLFSISRALATGRPPQGIGEHREVPVGSRT